MAEELTVGRFCQRIAFLCSSDPNLCALPNWMAKSHLYGRLPPGALSEFFDNFCHGLQTGNCAHTGASIEGHCRDIANDTPIDRNWLKTPNRKARSVQPAPFANYFLMRRFSSFEAGGKSSNGSAPSNGELCGINTVFCPSSDESCNILWMRIGFPCRKKAGAQAHTVRSGLQCSGD